MLLVCTLAMMWWSGIVISQNALPQDKHQKHPILGICDKNTWPVVFRTVHVTKIDENLRNCHNEEEPKETQQLRVMWYPGQN